MSNTRRPRHPQSSKSQRSTTTAVIVGLVVAACIAAIVVIGLVISGGDDDTASAGASSATESSAATPTPSDANSSAPSGASLDCDAPPAVPAKPQQFDSPPPVSLADDSTWTATVKTNCGDVTLELFGDKAPQTVSSFIYLAQQGYFDDSPCHRLTTAGIYVLQCGDPTGSGTGGPGYTYGIENAPANGDYQTGALAMARSSDPDSNGSQFFIVYNNTQLPTEGGGYSIFGQVTGGLDLLRAIAAQGVTSDDPEGDGDGAPAQAVSILSISVEKH